MSQLYDIMYEFNFSLPPDYALVIRALGSLEGTAKVLDPDFKVVESAYPFVIGRLLADPNPDMRKILRELLIRNDGSIRWNRLERLVSCIFFHFPLIVHAHTYVHKIIHKYITDSILVYGVLKRSSKFIDQVVEQRLHSSLMLG